MGTLQRTPARTVRCALRHRPPRPIDEIHSPAVVLHIPLGAALSQFQPCFAYIALHHDKAATNRCQVAKLHTENL